MQLLHNHILVLLYEIPNSLIKKYANLLTTQLFKNHPNVLLLVDIPKWAISPQYVTQFKNPFVKRVLQILVWEFFK